MNLFRAKSVLILGLFVSVFLACNEKKQKTDAEYLEQHYREILMEVLDFTEEEDISTAEMHSILRMEENGKYLLDEGKIIAPKDSSFKVFNFEAESCVAYCNPEWYSFLHFYNDDSLIIQRAKFSNISNIHKLPDGKYLVLDNSYARRGPLAFVCESAHLISFEEDLLFLHPIDYNEEDFYFQYCQEQDVEMEDFPFITYNDSLAELHYLYGNNYLYSDDKDMDTIRSGYFSYKNGKFIHQEENITVNNRSNSLELTPELFQKFLSLFEPIQLPFSINEDTEVKEENVISDEDTLLFKTVLEIESIAGNVWYGSYSGVYSFEHNDRIIVIVQRYYTPGAFGINNTFIEMYSLSKEGKLLDSEEIGCFCHDTNMGNNEYYDTSIEVLFEANNIRVYQTNTHATLIEEDDKESFEDIERDTILIEY